MALNTLKCNHLTSLGLKGLSSYHVQSHHKVTYFTALSVCVSGNYCSIHPPGKLGKIRNLKGKMSSCCGVFPREVNVAIILEVTCDCVVVLFINNNSTGPKATNVLQQEKNKHAKVE